MATIKYYDLLGATTASNLIGESGYLPLSSLVTNYSSYTISWADDGYKLSEKFYSGTTLTYTFELSYASVTTPAPDKKISLINEYNGTGSLLASWSGLDLSLKDLLQKSVAPVFQGEDSIEGNASNNYLQGALGDDILKGLAGADTLEGGRGDDTLLGGAGNDTLYGGLGTDYAAFSGPASSYRWSSNTDGSINVSDTTNTDGVDRLYDVEWLLFDYGKTTQTKILVSKLVYGTTGSSLISGWSSFNPADTSITPAIANIVTDGSKWTFTQNVHTIGWAIANNGAYQWSDVQSMQDAIASGLEEFTKVANINFQYFGAYSSITAAKADGADYVYSLAPFSDPNTVAAAFFPNPNEGSSSLGRGAIQFSPTYKTYTSAYESFYKFVTMHETGHTLGLKHPHNASLQNANTVTADTLSQFMTIMSYYNETAAQSLSNQYYPTTPMALDVIALEAMYGLPNYREALGDTTYSIVSSKSYQTIVDFSGKNTLDARAASEGWSIVLDDTGAFQTAAVSIGSTYPTVQVVQAVGNFSNAYGSSFDDAIVGSVNANNIVAGDGNDFVWSYGGGDTLDGGNGLDTLVFTEKVTDFAISSGASGAITFAKSSVVFATATSFESFRFGYGTSQSKDITLAQLKSYIVDTPAVITTTLTGSPKEYEKIGAKVVITDADGVGTYSIQWQSKTSAGSWTDLTGQTGNSLSLTQSHVDQTIRATINYIDAIGHSQTAYSAATAAVLNVNDLPTGTVTVSGRTLAGEVLTADASLVKDQDGLGSFNYQWQRSADGSKWDAIEGATARTYTISDADTFDSLRVVVSYQDGYQTQESVTSAATGIVDPTNYLATGIPVIRYQDTAAVEDSTLSVPAETYLVC